MENKNSKHRNLEKIKINKTIQGCRYACTYVCLHIHTYAYKYINIYTSQITILANCMSSEFGYMMLHLWLNYAYTDDMKPSVLSCYFFMSLFLVGPSPQTIFITFSYCI